VARAPSRRPCRPYFDALVGTDGTGLGTEVGSAGAGLGSSVPGVGEQPPTHHQGPGTAVAAPPLPSQPSAVPTPSGDTTGNAPGAALRTPPLP
jgi:hypothetical protein